jgi:hypothetical protein
MVVKHICNDLLQKDRLEEKDETFLYFNKRAYYHRHEWLRHD